MAQQTNPATLTTSFTACSQALHHVANEQATIAQELSLLANAPVLVNQQVLQQLANLNQLITSSITANAAQFRNLKAMQRNQRIFESTQNLSPLYNIQTNAPIPNFPANLGVLMTNLSAAQIRSIIAALTSVAPAPGITLAVLRQELRREIGCSDI